MFLFCGINSEIVHKNYKIKCNIFLKINYYFVQNKVTERNSKLVPSKQKISLVIYSLVGCMHSISIPTF